MIIKAADLTSVISDVIENLAMMVVEPPDQLEGFRPELYGWIEFTGPVNGKFSIQCPEILAQSLAANLLGTENSDVQTQTKAWDALAELLNVICGNLVTALFDSKRAFTLSIPQINVIPPTKNNDSNIENGIGNPPFEAGEGQTAVLVLDGQPAKFTLTVEK